MILSISGRAGSGKDTVGKIVQFLMHTEGKWDSQYWDTLYDSQLRPKVQRVRSNWPNYWAIKKFAGKLKTIASLLTGVPEEKFEDQEFKNSYMSDDWQYLKQMYECDENNQDGYSMMPMTYREFLQKLGTDAIRKGLHTNTWVNALFADYVPTVRKVQIDDVDERVKEMPNWIITDTRFPNEYKAVKNREGLIIKVDDSFRKDKNGYYIRTLREECTTLHESETALDSYTFDYVINNSGTIEDLVVEVQKMLKHFKLIP